MEGNKKYIALLISLFLFSLLSGVTLGKAENMGVDKTVGDMPVFPTPDKVGQIIFKPDDPNVKPVYFRHLIHRTKFVCKVCHLDLGFPLSVDGVDISQKDIEDGKWCGACHNSTIAFASSECDKCHYVGTEAEEKQNEKAKELADSLPKDSTNRWIDWVKVLDEGIIHPKSSLSEEDKNKEEFKELDLDVEFEPKEPGLPNVIFPHKVHTKWLACKNCHPSIFKEKRGADTVTMVDNFNGKFCGACHLKVSFPFDDCFRCHSKGMQ